MNTFLKLYPGDEALLVVGSTLVQVIALTLLALLAAALFARRNAVLRHGLYLAALAVILISPMTAAVGNLAGLNIVAIPISWIERPAAPEPVPALPPAAISKATPVVHPHPAPAALDTERAPNPMPPTIRLSPALTPAERLRAGITAVLIIWAAGTVFLLLRLIYGCPDST